MQKKVRLGDIATLITKGTTPTSIGYSFVDSGINFIKIESLNDQGGFIPEKFAFISEECNAKMQRSQLRENDILFSIAGAIGKKAVVSNNILPANTNQALAIIRIPKGKINHQYLFYALESDEIKKQFEKQKQGVAQLNLSLKDISELEINLVSKEEQDKTVAVIGIVDNLIGKRQQQLQKLDELVKARFIEMFGNPILNEKNNRISPLYEVCIKITDGTHDTPVRCPDGYLLVTGKNIREKGIIFDEVEYVSEEDHRLIYNRCNPEYGDVLYTNIGVNYGTACFNNLHYEFSMKNVALLKPNKEIINGYYLWECLNLMRSHLLEMNQVGGAQTFMSLSTIKKITIPVSDIKLQAEFADFVEEIDKSKLNVQKSLKKLETLKKALMQKYFG